MEKQVQKGCVVFMKASSGMAGYGNAQCISGYCEPLGEISLYGHNENYKTHDIDRVVESPQEALPTQPGVEYGKLRSDGDGHDFIIPLSLVEDFDHCMTTIEHIGCRGESSDSYYSALDRFEELYGQYQIDGDQRDFTVLLSALNK